MKRIRVFAAILVAVLTVGMIAGQCVFPSGLPANNAMKVSAASKQPLPDGDYTIMTAMDESFGLDLAGNSTASGTNVQLFEASNSDVWIFTLKYQSDGYYKICPKGADTCLDLMGGIASLYDGANIQIWTDNGSDAQRWKIEDAGDGYYYIRSKLDGRCLDVNGAVKENRRNIISQTINGGSNQKWKFVSRNAYTGEQTIPDGDYMIMSSLDTSFGLDLYANDTTSGTNVQLYNLTAENAEKFFRFTVTYQNDGSYKIALKKKKSLCLDLQGGTSFKWFSPNVQIYNDNNSAAQRWVIEDAGDGAFYIRSNLNGLYLDVAGAAAVNNANIRGWTLNGGAGQKWVFVPDQADTGISDISAFSLVSGIRIRWILEDDPNGMLYKIDKKKPEKTGSSKSSSKSLFSSDFGFTSGPAGVDIKYRIKEEGGDWTTVDVPLTDGTNYADLKGLEGGTEYEYTIRPYYQTKILGIVVGEKRYKQKESKVNTRTTLESNENDIILGDSVHEIIASAAQNKGWSSGMHVQYYIGTENCKYDMVNKNKQFQMRVTYGLVKSKVQYCWEIYDYEKNLYKSVYKGTLSALKEDLAVYAAGSTKPRLSTEYVEYKMGDKVRIKLKNAKGSAKWSLAKSTDERITYGGVEIVKTTDDSVTIEFTDKKGKWGVYPYVQAKVGKSIYRCYIYSGERLRW